MVWPQSNVILISIDTLRADHLGLYGYSRQTSPRLDGLAEGSFVFDRAYAHAADTLVSHASMLTSLYPVSHGARSPDVPLDEAVTTLAESMRAHGYQTAGFTSHPTWLNEKMGFAQGFDHFESMGAPAENRNNNVLNWLRSRRESPGAEETPFFLFIHYYDVHSDFTERPYETRTDFDDRFVGEYRGDFRGCRAGNCASIFLGTVNPHNNLLSEQELEWVVALYDGGIAYTDHHIGLLLDQFEDLGFVDSSWIVVTGDHGEEFLEHGRMLHSQPYEETARVPLIIKPPRNRVHRTISEPVGLVDLMPTLLDGVGIERGVENQGHSLIPLMRGEASTPAIVYFNELRDMGNVSLRSGRYTFVTRNRFEELELYDFHSDPEQRTNIADEYPEVSQGLRKLAKDFHEDQIQRVRSPNALPVELSEEEIERLRSLGYLVN